MLPFMGSQRVGQDRVTELRIPLQYLMYQKYSTVENSCILYM